MLKTAVKSWLRDHLIRLMIVQRCTLLPRVSVADPVRDTDVTVQTWSGNVIHIHLVDEPLKPARLKKIVEHATGAGIHTLFLVDAALLPRAGEHVPADRWYLAVYALTKDRLYAYYNRDGQPAVRRVEFTPVNRLEVQARYGADVEVHNLRHFRHSVRHSAVKGYWLLADFESDVPPKSAGFRQTTTPPPRADSGAPPPAAAPPTRLEAACALLGVSPQATREEVKAAFRKRAFAVHPDVSALPTAEAEARFKRLAEAYEIIKAARRWT